MPHLNSNLLHFLIAFLSFGYPLTASLMLILGVNDSTPINFSLRLFYLIISLYLISVNFSNILKINKYVKLIFVFWIIYSFRLLIDMSLHNLTFKSDFFIFSFAYGNGLIPMIAIVVSKSYFNLEKAAEFIHYTVLTSCILIVFNLINTPEVFELIFERRVSVGNEGNEHLLNPIAISFSGVILFISSLYKLIKKIKIFFLITCLIGLFCLVLGASRSPTLIAILISIFLLFKVKRNQIIYLIFIPLIILLQFIILNFDLLIVDRIIESSESYNEEGNCFYGMKHINLLQAYIWR